IQTPQKGVHIYHDDGMSIEAPDMTSPPDSTQSSPQYIAVPYPTPGNFGGDCYVPDSGHTPGATIDNPCTIAPANSYALAFQTMDVSTSACNAVPANHDMGNDGVYGAQSSHVPPHVVDGVATNTSSLSTSGSDTTTITETRSLSRYSGALKTFTEPTRQLADTHGTASRDPPPSNTKHVAKQVTGMPIQTVTSEHSRRNVSNGSDRDKHAVNPTVPISCNNIPVMMSNRSGPSYTGQARRNVGHSDRPPSMPRGKHTQHVGYIDEQPSHGEVYDDNDLLAYVRKKPKRFYIGGFKPGITEDVIYRYVQKRGPTPTMVRIFPMRQRYGVVIRLNVEDDESAHLLDTPQFWPRKIVCRPWLSRGMRESSRYNRRNNPPNDTENQHSVAHNYGSYNMYEELNTSNSVD
ncbi:MAG: hypothetical protein ABW185_19845, partial [Sedimenticola sp.]